ncbi:TPA: hypothetical protein ACH3X2_005862 [Trebouxia sp. C0005]
MLKPLGLSGESTWNMTERLHAFHRQHPKSCACMQGVVSAAARERKRGTQAHTSRAASCELVWLVVISGLVWNFPTSCAWAARVYVNNSAARNHGRKDVGLPSRLASFDDSDSLQKRKQQSWWHKQSEGAASDPVSIDSKRPTQQQIEASAAAASSSRGITVRNVERRHWAQPWRKNHEQLQTPVCSLDLPEAAKGWKGPRLKLSLPSFSGNTAEHPRLLQYACRLSTNIRPTAAARVHVSGSEEDNDMEVMAGVLGGRPVLALCFENMEMKVHAPAAYTIKAPARQLTAAAAL